MNSIYKKLAAYGLSGALALSGGYLVSTYEGKVNKTYLDPVNIITSCYGHTGPELKLGQKFTDDECLEQLADDLVEHDKGMLKAIKVPLTDYQHAAFLSFCFNVGVKACTNSTAFKKLNAKDYAGACNELLRWTKAKGKVLAGLVKRREAERKVCLGELPNEVKTISSN